MIVKLTPAQRIKISNADDLFAIMRDILIHEDKIDRDREHFWIIGLATNFRILYIELVCLGTVSETIVEPMNVFRVAVLKGAVSVILVHNHPSGELKPSAGDKEITDRLFQVGRILNIEVNDHLIISTKSYLSFADIGLMKELEQSTKFVPPFELIERIKKEEKKLRDEAVKVAEEKGIKKGIKEGIQKGISEGIEIGKGSGFIDGMMETKQEIAFTMILNKEPLERITKYTGLTKKEIDDLKKEGAKVPASKRKKRK